MNWLRENIEKLPSFYPFIDKIEVIENCMQSNPSLCVETCKSLIEGICKSILSNKGINYKKDIDFHVLVKQTIESIINVEERFRSDLAELGRRISAVSQKLGNLRDNAGFASHGLDILNPGLTETVSIFSCKITDTIGGFILSSYANNRSINRDQRIHYSECSGFNIFFDDLNPITMGYISLSASEALYQQDYEAYKEAYFGYLDDLANQTSE